MEKDGVLVVGSANMDLVVTSERFPNPGETVFGKNFAMFPGGKGANQAVGCAKLGAKTYFLGKMGNDDFHNMLNKSLGDNGVDIKDVLVEVDGQTGVALISVDGSGENEIIVISGTNMKFTKDDLLTKKDYFSKVKVVLCQLEIPVETVTLAARLAKESNAIFILNPAPAFELNDELLSQVDFLTPNESELEILSGCKVDEECSAEKAAKVLLEKGVKNVLVTVGERGAILVNTEGTKKFEARKMNAIDTTAAGDSFNGALAYSLSNGRTLDEAIQFANYAAALSVTKMGAQTSMPTLKEVEAIL
ncbi:ribokinase [hydrocarbon metagenome]|uniref:Ribokinase n=1 Tax=hydrocarbon metagenome TaxID=938273 RepID=A0A0W8FYR4_9ZZZZ